jgi:hypothetical protein
MYWRCGSSSRASALQVQRPAFKTLILQIKKKRDKKAKRMEEESYTIHYTLTFYKSKMYREVRA